MGMGNQDFHGNDLGENGKSRFLRELFGWDHRNDICTGIGTQSIPIAGNFQTTAALDLSPSYVYYRFSARTGWQGHKR